MEFDLPNAANRKNVGLHGQDRAFVLLQRARLRCETLVDGVGHRAQLVAIHREIGLAGYETCAEFDAEHRRDCLALAMTDLSDDPVPAPELLATQPGQIGETLAKMFSETISASDALAGELAVHEVLQARRDRLHLVHAHVMAACELLDERLTVLELESAGIDRTS